MKAGAFAFLRLTILLWTLIALGARGQSVTVSFRNAGLPSPPDRLVRDAQGNPLVGTNYLAQLYAGNSPDTLVANTAPPARFRVPTTTLPGTWTGGDRQLVLPQPGPVYLQVRVWDVRAGPTYEIASQNSSGQYGRSAIFVFDVPIPPYAPGAFDMHNFRGFTLMPDTPGHALAIRELPDGGVEILYDGTHTIERAASLRGPWLTLGTQSGPMTDTGAASEAVRFYRINDNGVYSENVVGFYQLSLCNGFSLIANQLNAVGGNRISNLFKSPPEGTRVYKFNPALGGFVIAQFIDGAWEGSDAEMTLNPGEGAFMQTSLTSHRFLGDVPSGNLGVQIPQGFSLISNHLPEAGPVNLLPPDGIGLPVRDGTRIYQWHCLTQGFLFSQYVDGMWERDGSLGAPTVAIGEAFYFYNPGPALMWNRSFSVAP